MQVIEVVVGAQYGSEGKGHVTAQLVQQALKSDRTVINIRVAGPNAGHTVYDDNGVKFALRSVPVGAAISDDVICYIAPGSEVDLEVLASELALLRDAGHDPAVLMSGEATLLEEKHKVREQVSGIAGRIGSTGKGIGAARADRIMRSASRVKDSGAALAELDALGVGIIEPEVLYATDHMSEMLNQHIIIEGTQGFGLGLHAGHYPQCTSSDARAIDFLAMAGLSPWRRTVQALVVWVVARVYPIRVAGNSGPMIGETSWEDLGLPEEHTTVTQKVRRVGAWDGEMVARAVQANGGSTVVKIALTMVDQLYPEVAGFDGSEESITKIHAEHPEVFSNMRDWLRSIEEEAEASVGAVTTSPTTIAFTE